MHLVRSCAVRIAQKRCGVTKALPHPVTLSGAKGLNSRSTEALQAGIALVNAAAQHDSKAEGWWLRGALVEQALGCLALHLFDIQYSYSYSE